MEVSTRFAINDDLEVLALFEREIACLSFPEDPITDLDYHYRKLVRAMRAEPDGLIVLTIEEEVVGWLWMSTKTTLATKERYGVLRSIYVRPDLRRQGLSKSLAQYCVRYFESQGIRRVVAKIHHENDAAKALMRRIGLELVHLTYEYRSPDHTRRPEPLEDGHEPFGGDDVV